MHRVGAVIVVALAVALAVAYRVWTADEPVAPATRPEAASPEPVEVSTTEEAAVESSRSEAPATNAQPAASPGSANLTSIAGIVVEQESRRPVPGATITAYDAGDRLDGVDMVEAMEVGIEMFSDANAIEMFDEDSFTPPLWDIPDDIRTHLGDVTAGSDGRFAMEVPIDEQTFLECSAPGYATAFLRVQESEDPSSLRITLQQSGHVRGRVTDADNGRPIAGVLVSVAPNASLASMARAMSDGDFSQQREHKTETDEDGRYELSGIPVGAFRVTVDAQSKGYIVQVGNAPVINIEAGIEVENADVQLNRGGFVFGTLSDRSGEPVVTAHFNVTPKAGNDFGNMLAINAAGVGSWSEVDDDGAFRLGALEYGVDYKLKVSDSDYAPVTQDIRLQPGRDAGPLSILFTRGGSVSGIARYLSGDPATEIGLILRGDDETMFDWTSGTTQFGETRDDGTFTFEHLPDGAYQISSTGVMGFQGDQGAVAEVLNGRDVTGIELTVEDESDEPTEPVTGTVVDPQGRPVAGIEVTAFEFADIGGDSVETDAEGRFSLELTPVLGNSFTLEAKGDAGYKRLTGVRPGTEVRLKLGPSARVAGIVVNQRGDPIADCAVSLESESGGFMDMMPFGGGDDATTTDDEGRFEIADIKPGAYVVAAESRTQGTGKSKSIQIDEGKTVDGIRVILEPGARISGHVLGPDRRPVARAQVSLTSEDSGPFAAMAAMMPDELSVSAAAATTNDRGEFSIPDVPPGTYTVTASHSEFAKASLPGMTLRSGEDVRGIDLMLAVGGGASGVYTVDGQPVAGVMIQLVGAGGMKMLTTDAEGRFDVTGLPAGTYMVIAMDMNDIDTSDTSSMAGFSNMNQRSVEIVDGQITDIDFTPPVGVEVSGTIASLGLGENAMVRLRTPDGVSFSDLDFSDPISTGMDMISASAGFGDVEADGTFNIDHVEPGQYVLEVYQQPDPSTIDFSGDFDMESMQAFMPVLIYTQEITVNNAPIQVTIGATVP